MKENKKEIVVEEGMQVSVNIYNPSEDALAEHESYQLKPGTIITIELPEKK